MPPRKTPSVPSTVFVLRETAGPIISVHTTHDAAKAASAAANEDTTISEHALLSDATAPAKSAAPAKAKKPAPAAAAPAADKTRTAAFHAGNPDLSVPAPGPNALAGRAVCFTGELVTMKRKEAQGLAEAAGAKVHGSITKTVNLVVLGKDAGPKKLEQIEKNGVETIDEETFLQWVGEGGEDGGEDGEDGEEDDEDDDEEEERPSKKRARGSK